MSGVNDPGGTLCAKIRGPGTYISKRLQSKITIQTSTIINNHNPRIPGTTFDPGFDGFLRKRLTTKTASSSPKLGSISGGLTPGHRRESSLSSSTLSIALFPSAETDSRLCPSRVFSAAPGNRRLSRVFDVETTMACNKYTNAAKRKDLGALCALNSTLFLINLEYY